VAAVSANSHAGLSVALGWPTAALYSLHRPAAPHCGLCRLAYLAALARPRSVTELPAAHRLWGRGKYAGNGWAGSGRGHTLYKPPDAALRGGRNQRFSRSRRQRSVYEPFPAESGWPAHAAPALPRYSLIPGGRRAHGGSCPSGRTHRVSGVSAGNQDVPLFHAKVL